MLFISGEEAVCRFQVLRGRPHQGGQASSRTLACIGLAQPGSSVKRQRVSACLEDKGIEMRESWWREIFKQCLQGALVQRGKVSSRRSYAICGLKDGYGCEFALACLQKSPTMVRCLDAGQVCTTCIERLKCTVIPDRIKLASRPLSACVATSSMLNVMFLAASALILEGMPRCETHCGAAQMLEELRTLRSPT